MSLLAKDTSDVLKHCCMPVMITTRVSSKDNQHTITPLLLLVSHFNLIDFCHHAITCSRLNYFIMVSCLYLPKRGHILPTESKLQNLFSQYETLLVSLSHRAGSKLNCMQNESVHVLYANTFLHSLCSGKCLTSTSVSSYFHHHILVNLIKQQCVLGWCIKSYAFNFYAL